MRWISLHLPQLPLEALARGAPMPDPIAIVEAQRILVCDARAWHRGVRPGMKLAAATALAPQLRPLARDPAAETEALLGLAGWASQFTPSVALELPQSTGRSASPFELGGRGGDSDVTSQPSSSPSGHRAPIPTSPPPGGRHSASRAHMHALPPAHSAAALLLEIEGSLRLFGSVETIAQRLRTGAEAMGFDAYVASAPTPRAATWLARSGRTAHVVVIDDLPSRLAPLPLAVTGCDAGMLESLDAIGAHTVGDLLALPRAGLARRFGQALLDQALGRAPDPRTFFVPPPTFRARIEFVAEVTQAEALLFAAHRLLVQLEGYLVARASAVPRFSLVIAHRGARAIAGYFIQGYANINETYANAGPHDLGSTTAVGMYPRGASPYGAMDMSGNVWEWCVNEHERRRRTRPTGDAGRVLRGGSWHSYRDNARATWSRYWRSPHIRENYIGFRVLRVSAVSRFPAL